MTNSSGNPVEVERRDAVAWMTLNRPHTINAINQEIRVEVPRLLRELDEDPTVRIIVVRGAGVRGFCAGADLKEDQATSTQRESDPLAWIEAFARVAKPVIASIHGYCLGGGLEIALACDIRIAAVGASFGLPEPAIGLIPGGGGTQRLPRLIGLARALDLLISAERIDAVEAHRVGLVTRLAASTETLPAETTALAARIAALPPAAVRSVKQAAYEGTGLDLTAGLLLERQLFFRLSTQSNRHEARAAFQEKRPPSFREI